MVERLREEHGSHKVAVVVPIGFGRFTVQR